jgi:hypothetical protein
MELKLVVKKNLYNIFSCKKIIFLTINREPINGELYILFENIKYPIIWRYQPKNISISDSLVPLSHIYVKPEKL